MAAAQFVHVKVFGILWSSSVLYSTVLFNHQLAVELLRVQDNFSSILQASSPGLEIESVFTNISVKFLEEFMFTPL